MVIFKTVIEMVPGKYAMYKLPLRSVEVIIVTPELLDAAWLFRIVSCMNEDPLFLLYLVPVGVGQLKDANGTHGKVVKIPCDIHCVA